MRILLLHWCIDFWLLGSRSYRKVTEAPEVKKKFFVEWGSIIQSDTYWQSNLSSPFPLLFLLPLLFSVFASSIHLFVHLFPSLSLSPYLDKLPPHWSVEVFSIFQAKAYPSRQHNARTNQKRRWKIIDAFFLFHKSSVSGSILSLSLTDDTWHNPYPFSAQVSMMVTTAPLL